MKRTLLKMFSYNFTVLSLTDILFILDINSEIEIILDDIDDVYDRFRVSRLLAQGFIKMYDSFNKDNRECVLFEKLEDMAVTELDVYDDGDDDNCIVLTITKKDVLFN